VDVNAPTAQVINATDMIVLPGLIETHWHMWNTLFRSFAGDG
jgi:5-methylthioadenosine/S-adenosylhomocysteine deaminase